MFKSAASLGDELKEGRCPGLAGLYCYIVKHGGADVKDLTPEHTKRKKADGLHPDVEASLVYVDQVLWTADSKQDCFWYGWALREAFLAGISYEKNRTIERKAKTRHAKGGRDKLNNGECYA